MINVLEHKTGNQSFFEIQYLDEEGVIINTELVSLNSSIIKESNANYLYYLLYDKNRVPISPVFDFINFSMGNSSPNTKEKTLYALKYLYFFLDLFNVNLQSLTNTDITNLKYFLKGMSPKGHSITLNLQTNRSNETINGYLGIYRGYIKFLNYNDSPLLNLNTKSSRIFLPLSENEIAVKGYSTNEQLYKITNQTPKYISISDFKNTLKLVRESYTLKEEIILRLMFEGGLRIGEVLGLTFEDVKTEKFKNDYYPVIYIRNRNSDKNYQRAKTCMNIFNIKQYKSKDYQLKNYGYQLIIISKQLLELIDLYIEKAHSVARENYQQQYDQYTRADQVDTSDNFGEENYYIFINKLAKPLSSHLWNITLREIFQKVDLIIDKGSRENNLNHRFRHGFAMYHVQYFKLDSLKLMQLMRHRSIESVASYYNPTLEDIVEMKDDFVQDIYSIIPELNLRR